MTFLHGALYIRILKRRCTVCGKKKRNSSFDWDKDTPTSLNLVCLACERKGKLEVEKNKLPNSRATRRARG